MREIDKTLILMTSKIVQAANIFVLSIFFARILSKADYGTYIQFNMIVSLSIMTLSIGIPASLFYFLPKNIKQKAIIYRSLLILLVIGSLCLLLIHLFRNELAASLNNEELSNYSIFLGMCIIFMMCSQLIRPILMVAKESLVLAGVNAGKGVLFFISMVLCLFIRPEVSLLIRSLFTIYLVEFLVSIWVLYKYSNRFSEGVDALKIKLGRQMKFALPLFASGILWLLGREIDKYIISYYLTPGELAVYARGAVEIPLIHIFAGTIAQVYLPDWVKLFDEKKYDLLIEGWHTTVSKTALIMFPIFCVFQVISYEFIVMLYSPEYSGSVLIFTVYLFLVPLQLTEYTAIIESSGRPIWISIGYAVQIVFNVIFSVLLLKKIGSVGPAMMTVISMYLWTGYMLFIISRTFGRPFLSIFPWKKLFKIMCLSIGSGAIVYMLKKVLEGTGVFNFLSPMEIMYMLEIGVVFVLFGIIYVGLLYMTNSLDADDKETIYRWLMIAKIKKVMGL